MDKARSEELALKVMCVFYARQKIQHLNCGKLTLQLDKRLNENARNLNDGKHLAVISGGDVLTQ